MAELCTDESLWRIEVDAREANGETARLREARRALYDAGRADARAEALSLIDAAIAQAEGKYANLAGVNLPVCVIGATRILGEVDGLRAARAAIVGAGGSGEAVRDG